MRSHGWFSNCIKMIRRKLSTLTGALLESALHLYRDRSDKAWGLVDCVSFFLMQELGLTEAFTADRHFEQAGYVRLLK